ncbi:MAG: tRNA dimethylallyltransferase [Acidobacteriaceae bacterium]|nr:tRNA dimethylallyltransferase [Acidobacteriaceae bacterium]
MESLVELPPPLLVVILGPTGSGKTALSVALAQQFDGEIISCDSVAVYQGLEIGSAKPSAGQRRQVPHHLLDVVTPDAFYTAGDYSRAARTSIATIDARGKLPIVTGGTGLYLRALLQGLFPGPQRSAGLRDRLLRKAETRGPAVLHRILKRLDPASAARVHANDVAKVIRAIEVTLAVGQPMSEAWKEGREPLTGYRVLRLGLDPQRPQLYERINARARAMFAEGLIEETRELLARYGPSLALASLGYRQAAQFLEGNLTLEQAIAAASQGHRNYAKRQLTWFRREPEVCWLNGFGDDLSVIAEAERLVARAKS